MDGALGLVKNELVAALNQDGGGGRVIHQQLDYAGPAIQDHFLGTLSTAQRFGGKVVDVGHGSAA